MTTNKRVRIHLMMHAYLTHHARKFTKRNREWTVWAFLMEWARLGGLPTEVIGYKERRTS